MKTYLIILLLSLVSIGTEAQAYRTLQECKNDTLSYLRYNFDRNKGRYIGKTMQFFMDEVEIDVITKTFYSAETGPFAPVEIRSKICGIYFQYLYFSEVMRREYHRRPYYSILVIFEVPPYTHTEDEFQDLCKKSKDPETEDAHWHKGFYEFFKDYIIKDICIRPHFTNENENENCYRGTLGTYLPN